MTRLRDEHRELVGRTIATLVSFPVAASDIRRWAIAVHYPEPPPERYWSVADDELAPEDFNPFAWSLTPGYDPEAPERALGVEPPPAGQVLNGGVDTEYTGVGIRVGDVITSVSAISGYTERAGRTGPMLFTTIESRWVNQRGEPVCTHRMTTIRS